MPRVSYATVAQGSAEALHGGHEQGYRVRDLGRVWGKSPDEAELAFENVGVPPASRFATMLAYGIFPFVSSSCSDTIEAQWLHAHQFRGSPGAGGGGWLECKWCLGRCNVTKLLHCGPRGIGCSLMVLELGDLVLMGLPIIGV